MKIKHLILLSLLILSSNSFAQGWKNMNFGIDQAEIIKILSDEGIFLSNESDTYENGKYHVKIGIKDFIIGDHIYHVQFLMNKDNVLGKILYSLEDVKEKLQTYQGLVNFYSIKITAPDSVIDENSGGVMHKENIWKTPGSTISISYHYYSHLNVEMVFISYLPPNKID